MAEDPLIENDLFASQNLTPTPREIREAAFPFVYMSSFPRSLEKFRPQACTSNILTAVFLNRRIHG